MRILFKGSVIFSKLILEKLFINNFNIVGVCTKNKSTFNLDFYNLSNTCKKFDIPYMYTKDINSKITFNWIKKKNLVINT